MLLISGSGVLDVALVPALTGLSRVFEREVGVCSPIQFSNVLDCDLNFMLKM